MTLEEKIFVDRLNAQAISKIVAAVKKCIERTDNYSEIYDACNEAYLNVAEWIVGVLKSKGLPLYEWDSRQLDASYYHMRYLVGFHNFTYRVINEKRGMFRGYFCWN